MNIKPHEITCGQLAEGYEEKADDNVLGYGGKLDIRPPYQREFVYDAKQSTAVIHSVMNGFPLNTMYWAVREDGRFEIVDGQQRTISICRYIDGQFPINEPGTGQPKHFHNLPDNARKAILDYPLLVYACTGSDGDRLRWFETINIAGKPLTQQELRNANYHGPWLADAKRHFSRPGGVAAGHSDYLKGALNRQEYLETAIDWLAGGRDCISAYMDEHRQDPTATELVNHFTSTMNWTKATFPEYRKSMKGVAWGRLWNEHGQRQDLIPAELEHDIADLHQNEAVPRKSGIYEYLLTGQERHLQIRAFTDAMRQTAYERQGGVCAITGEHLPIDDMEADHIKPWTKGGKTESDNCQMVSRLANRQKGSQ